jgi:hypothetical protein
MKTLIYPLYYDIKFKCCRNSASKIDCRYNKNRSIVRTIYSVDTFLTNILTSIKLNK